MKRIAIILKDAFGVIGIAFILGTTFFAATNAAAQEDLYEIEQQTDTPFNMLYISEGWDAHLIQAPAGSPTTVVLRTRCAEFFEEGNEPDIVEVKKLDKKSSWLHLNRNSIMPHTTVVEIHTAQPIGKIHLYKGSRLTIEQYDFDSIDLDIDADTDAMLFIDTMHNLGSTSISLNDATLDLRRSHVQNIFIYAHGHSTVNKGKLLAKNQYLRLSDNTICNVTESDSATHLYVTRAHWLNKADKLTSLSLTMGFDLGYPIIVDGSRQGSPYNTNLAPGIVISLSTNSIPISKHWGWGFGLTGAFHIKYLDNVVRAADKKHLVLDASHGATPPRQEISYWTLGLPVSIFYTLPKDYRPWFRGFHASLTPMLNFKQTLNSQTLNEHNRWTYSRDKGLDLLNRFNLRASVGVDMGFFGIKTIEFFIDLLPSYKPTAEAPQMRMLGLMYHF